MWTNTPRFRSIEDNCRAVLRLAVHAGQRISFLIVGYDSRPTSEAVDNVEEQLAIEIGDQCREILTNNWPGPVVVLVKTDPPPTADPRARAHEAVAENSRSVNSSMRSRRES